MLGELPSEVLAAIATHLIMDTGGPPVDLICTCRGACLALSPSTNEGLYAGVFRQLYDTGAVERRLYALETALPEVSGKGKAKAGTVPPKQVSAVPSIASLQVALEKPRAPFMSAASSAAMTRDNSRGLGASAKMLTAELRNRFLAFRKLREGRIDEQAMSPRPQAEDCSPARSEGSHEDSHGEGRTTATTALQANPADTTDGKNLAHLVPPLSSQGADIPALIARYHASKLAILDAYPPQTPTDALVMWCAWLLDEYMTNTTPAAMRQLRPYVFAAQEYDMFFAPWNLRRLPLPANRGSIPAIPGPFTVNQNPEDHAVTVSYYGSELSLRPPMLAHAAMLRFFTNQDCGFEPGTSPTASPTFPQPHTIPTPPSTAPSSVSMSSKSSAELRTLPTPVLESSAHDADFDRLLRCTDGRASEGRRLKDWHGQFAGAWEGTFTFLDFDAFRDMLLHGHSRAIYDGAYGEQAQVWKLRETLVRPILATRAPSPVPGASTAAAAAAGGGGGTDTPSEDRFDGFPLHGPMTNAGFPDLRPFLSDPLSRRAPGQSPEDAMIDDAVARQLSALHGYEAVEACDVASALEHDDPEALLLLTGVGHSAWGRFYISGYIRQWDGLAYLVKEYSPYQRGKWVYRGYVLGGDTMVGRWRDTFTAEEYVGYEGTFVLKRRSEG
ncbi:hypothetical protein A1Q2_07828 [Trichosporon asahii var. asahii CBS 8904]|uniref:F-box domain-containing protein n=1 Tax=Trichosporon asahii var. asahii (strain CBS 8904) TaxID=1220162 RepID=K1VAL5_TRIAC|nr:hypothetical protein A1Q2_07828 [Trichosporon asahii var. asahii CBS 8904]